MTELQRKRAEMWRDRTAAAANMALAVLYLTTATVVGTLGWLVYTELRP